jgi:hypothetical protein
MTEELISTLSKVGGLKIIARTSIMGYKKSNKKINEIANELGVNAILEGSVRKSGEKLRITVQLIDSKSTDYIWSETYDRSFEDIFAIQSDIANKVSQTLRVQLLTNWPQLRQKSTESTEAYTHYSKEGISGINENLMDLIEPSKSSRVPLRKIPALGLLTRDLRTDTCFWGETATLRQSLLTQKP